MEWVGRANYVGPINVLSIRYTSLIDGQVKRHRYESIFALHGTALEIMYFIVVEIIVLSIQRTTLLDGQVDRHRYKSILHYIALHWRLMYCQLKALHC